MSKSVTEQLQVILDQFAAEESAKIEKTFNSVAEETREEVGRNSPRAPGGGKYAAGWKVKKSSQRGRSNLIGGVSVTIYNKDHYRLTHLLEKGHVVRNQFGAGKGKQRTAAQPHIKDAEEWGAEKLIAELERNL